MRRLNLNQQPEFKEVPLNIRVRPVVRKRSPRVRQTASARMALEMVYPGQRPAPSPGCFDSSHISPGYRVYRQILGDLNVQRRTYNSRLSMC